MMTTTPERRHLIDGDDASLRQRTKQFLSVDFVTALPLEECAELLSCCDNDLNQTVTVAEDGSFSLRRVIADDNTEISFWGTLETVERGTWVWGTIFEARKDGMQSHPWIPAFAVMVMLFMVLDAILRNAFSTAAIWVGVIAVLGVLAVARWRWRYRHGLAMVEWVYELLYERPPSDKKSQDTA